MTGYLGISVFRGRLNATELYVWCTEDRMDYIWTEILAMSKRFNAHKHGGFIESRNGKRTELVMSSLSCYFLRSFSDQDTKSSLQPLSSSPTPPQLSSCRRPSVQSPTSETQSSRHPFHNSPSPSGPSYLRHLYVSTSLSSSCLK